MNRRTFTSRLFFTILYIIIVVLARPVLAGDVLGLDGRIGIAENGDSHSLLSLTLEEELYSVLRKASPDGGLLLRLIAPRRADQVYGDDTWCRFDDATGSATLSVHRLGAARYEGRGEWRYDAPTGLEFINIAPDSDGAPSAFFLADVALEHEITLRGHILLSLPLYATDVRWDARDGSLRYRLEVVDSAETADLHIDFSAREVLMSCLYKMYALETDGSPNWVARSALRNNGRSVIRDLRVRYRVDGYAEWSAWQRLGEVAPGQTVLSVYHPVLDRSIAEIRSTTPCNVLAEWRYRDADGALHEEADARRISILGVRQFLFSEIAPGEAHFGWFDQNFNAPLLAAWVMQDDPIVAEFAAMANRMAGGEGAMYSDEAALKVLRACYDLMIRNDFTYQGPVGFDNTKLQFDNGMIQRIKFPREVIKERSGTCIELSTLFASMANAVGLKPFIVIVPGHALVVIELPSGTTVAIETTGVRGGLSTDAVPFDLAVSSADKTINKAKESSRIIVIDVQEMWMHGVVNPELPALRADALAAWNISETGAAAAGLNAPAAVDHTPLVAIRGADVEQIAQLLRIAQ